VPLIHTTHIGHYYVWVQ